MAVQHPSIHYQQHTFSPSHPTTEDSSGENSRQYIIEQMEDADTFQTVLMKEPHHAEPDRIQKLRRALQEEPLNTEEVFGSEEHLPNPALQANLYEQLAKYFQKQANTTSHRQTARRSQQYAVQLRHKLKQFRDEPDVFSTDSPQPDSPLMQHNDSQATTAPSFISRIFAWLYSWFWDRG
jgi:hypothetical protein